VLGCRSWYSDGLRAGQQRARISSPGRSYIFLFSTSSRPVLRSTRPPVHWRSGTLSPRVKRPGHEVDHSLPTNAEVKNMCIYTFAPPYVFTGGNFIFFLRFYVDHATDCHLLNSSGGNVSSTEIRNCLEEASSLVCMLAQALV
jgi:hypothetical protein